MNAKKVRQRLNDNTHRSKRHLVAIAIPRFVRVGWNARSWGLRLRRKSEADTRAKRARSHGRLFGANHSGWMNLLLLRFGGLGSSSLLALLWCLGWRKIEDRGLFDVELWLGRKGWDGAMFDAWGARPPGNDEVREKDGC